MKSVIRIIDDFKRRPSDRNSTRDLSKDINSGYEDDIKKMTQLAEKLNAEKMPVELFFYGDERIGLRFNVSCEDGELEVRIKQVLEHYRKSKEDL